MARRRTVNYLNNRDIAAEIHKSKNTYCKYDDPKYSNYDFIIDDINLLTDEDLLKERYDISFDEWIESIIESKVKKLNRLQDDKKYSADDFTLDDLIFRWMTFEHIPLDDTWPEGKPKKKASDGFLKVNFPPFQHFILEGDLPRCVGLSHYDKEGIFNTEHGITTSKLGNMYMLLVEKISNKSNGRKWTYLDEMKSSALLQLSAVGLQFNESRVGKNGQINPFAFYTAIVNNAFKRVLNSEKRMRDIRDDLLEFAGQKPSISRQVEQENYDNEIHKSWSSSDSEIKERKSK